MTHPSLRRGALAVLGVAIALTGLSCAGGGGGGTVGVIAAAVSKTSSGNTARFRMEMTMSGQELGGSLTIPVEGEMDFRDLRARMTMDFPEIPGSPDLGQVEMVMDGTVFYMRSPAFTQTGGLSTPWIKFDLEELTAGAVDLQTLSSSRTDPTQALEYLRGMGEVTKVGTEEIDGTATTHYRGIVDLRRAVENAPESNRDALEAAVDQFEEFAGTTTFPEDVWIGSDGRVRRMEFAFHLSDPKSGQTFDMGMRMDLFDFGVDVVVEPPPDDQVTDLSDLAGASSP
ncbi:MAG: hypothetical protein ABR518_00025 [Actinomycetota bacterium]